LTNLFIDTFAPLQHNLPACQLPKEREVEVGKIKLSTNCKGQGPLEEKRRDLLPDPKGKGDYWRKKNSYPPAHFKGVGNWRRKKSGRKLEGKKNIISVGLVRIHLKIGN
jgi:hypothetical protein